MAQSLISSLVILSALLSLSCAGKAIDDPGATGDGDGDGETPVQPIDPLSDAGFPDAYEERVLEYCENLESCGELPDGLSCRDLFREAEFIYNLEARQCRSLMLDTLDCMNESWQECGVVPDVCVDVTYQLENECLY